MTDGPAPCDPHFAGWSGSSDCAPERHVREAGLRPGCLLAAGVFTCGRGVCASRYVRRQAALLRRLPSACRSAAVAPARRSRAAGPRTTASRAASSS